MRLPADLDARSLSDLRALVIALVVKGTELERTVAAQRDEIARLKGLKGRPQIKPSGMEKASQALTQERATGKRRRKRAKSADLTIHEERIIKAGPVPPGSRFKGYQRHALGSGTSQSAAPAGTTSRRGCARSGLSAGRSLPFGFCRTRWRSSPSSMAAGSSPPTSRQARLGRDLLSPMRVSASSQPGRRSSI